MDIRRFLVCRNGNMAITFAVCLVPLLVGVGAAVDYARLADARELMQHSLDATVLALSSEAPKLTSTRLNERATEIFKVNFPEGKVNGVTVSATFTKSNGAVIAASASGTVPMTFLNLAGISSETLAVQSKSAWSSKRLRVALALDNTGSMAYSGKIEALKEATHDLLDKLKANSTTQGDIYVSIVPFNKDVNIGTGFQSSTIISWDKTGQYCSRNRDGSYTCRSNVRLWPSGKDKSEWDGCVSDRDKEYDISVQAATNLATKFPAEDYDSCLTPITALSDDWTALGNAVDALSAVGPTNQTIGLVWAWQSLKLGGPLDVPAKDANYDYQDVIILLSDGENTMNRFGGDGRNSSSQVDDRMAKVCDAAKADNMTIYTVLVISGNADVLRRCASSPSNYFNAATAGDIVTAFGAIGDKLSALRIAQ
ncbi:Flp pilus assembly protein TadG [Pleomorphomonas diazotrophica]|nr:TadE/TadG family type IV pilus assembly protein [Pleomorphomonas diazotrophica]SFM34311.1 Flp pilus assembly protein TadG [Pleomorphomonas diazotrophica]